MAKDVIYVVSLSGGKDSTATALIALELHGRDACKFVFADTGNEHQATYDYALGYLPQKLDITVDQVRADFSDEFATKRANLARIAAGEPESAVYGRRKFMYAWTQAAAARALDLLHPTGNPYLDLCLVRGGFPSRKRQFCTQYLKRDPLVQYQLELVDQGHFVESWQGVRSDESEARRWLSSYDWLGGGMAVYRPILRWRVADVFDAHAAAGIEPNPLYRQGMSRVGCMPCINSSKAELREIGKRFSCGSRTHCGMGTTGGGVCRPSLPSVSSTKAPRDTSARTHGSTRFSSGRAPTAAAASSPSFGPGRADFVQLGLRPLRVTYDRFLSVARAAHPPRLRLEGLCIYAAGRPAAA